MASIWRANMLGYLPADIIYSETRTLSSRAHTSRAKLEEKCELRGTDSVQGEVSEHNFPPNGSYCVYPSNIFKQGCTISETFSGNSLTAKQLYSRLKHLILFKIFSSISLSNLPGMKTKCANIHRKILKTGEYFWGIFSDIQQF